MDVEWFGLASPLSLAQGWRKAMFQLSGLYCSHIGMKSLGKGSLPRPIGTVRDE